jgi:uroporphyrinogen-III synthase
VSLSKSLPVIVTRAEPGASETMARLAAMDVTPIASPMLSLARLDVDMPDLSGVQHLVFTSANSVRFFTEASSVRAAKAWCVGPSTAGAAREAGFAAVYEGAGDAAALAADILVALPEGTEGVLHVANEAAAGDLVARLKEGGLPAEFLALYETRPSEDLTPEAEAALAAGPACVLIHSAKGAAAFAWAAGDLDQAIVVAISEAAARPLQGREVAAIHVAEAPNEDALLATLAAVADGL